MSGCSDQRIPPVSDTLAPIKVVTEGDIADHHGPPFSLRLNLSGRSKFLPGESIDVSCDVELPPGSNPPQMVEIRIKDKKKRQVAGTFARKVGASDGCLKYALTLKAPSAAGRYDISAFSADTVMKMVAGRETETSTRETFSAPIQIQVQE
jgi:hypothetical protein